VAAGGPQGLSQDAAESGRQYWLKVLARLADPVLRNLAAGTLKRNMPVECPNGDAADRHRYSHLEALGRLLAGVAPWLEAPLPAGAERDAQQEYAMLAREAIRSATDPQSPDYLNFHEGSQPLVDCGFLAQALLRAPNALCKDLDGPVQRNLAAALASSRAITPGSNNWLMFAATVEAALAMMGERWDAMRVDYAIRQHQQWYLGDGVYGDGPQFHWDYYNSFVIQPMMLNVLDAVERTTDRWIPLRRPVEARARRYAAIQERLISPEGTFPPIGRSLAYRFGALQLLAEMALRRALPEGVHPAQVRCAMTAVMTRMIAAQGTFDSKGWLTIGFAGHQPAIGESYISTGSCYLCSTAWLPLGLAASDEFWSAPAAPWTAQEAWSGVNLKNDHAIAE
jgi:hypothetical protein